MLKGNCYFYKTINIGNIVSIKTKPPNDSNVNKPTVKTKSTWG